MKIGNKEFNTESETYIMGILNVTPDSFSDGGKWNTIEAALFHTERMINEGADIIDIGGESTRPGHEAISEQEEIERILPIIYSIKNAFDIPVSIDTYKSKVAKAALDEGADLVNDIWGLKYDSRMANLISEYKVPCCLMHNRTDEKYSDFMHDLIEDLSESIMIAKNAGIADERIILDPGIGFAKSYENNLEAINRLSELKVLGYPILLGASRKSFIAKALNLPVDERVEGTIVSTVFAVLNNCSFIRVHDIKENKRAIVMTQALMNENIKEV